MRGDKIMAEISLHAFKAKDTWFVTDWLKSKGLHKLCSVFEGIQKPFTLSLACKSVVSWSIKPCLHTQLPEHNKSYRKVSRGWGHLITWHGLIFSASGGGNLNKNFPKIQMPGGLPGGEGMLTLRFDWYIKQRKSQAWRRFGYPVLISIDFDDFTGFAKSRPAACGPRPTMARRPNAQRPTTCSGPEAQSWFSTVFCPAVNPCACTGLHRVWACEIWTTASLDSFTIIINNPILSFVACCYVKNAFILCLFVRLQNPKERKSILNDVSYC